jgi:hypothetical protein
VRRQGQDGERPVTAATRALPTRTLPTRALPARPTHVVASTVTLMPEASCRTCGILPAGGLYDRNAATRARTHVQQTGHIVTITSATSVTLRLDGATP